ncbi:linear amide C-N hydrolase [Cysteiniphilum sp. QT6929]|uniref:linear amide C-N hydrolase n=1 Tax=Cysteiniphilum sp. QT6929 TaxID=2975055 RepID=UPI0024B38DA9|nr:linear amide C-N hydrolase [Cysteiniphilum sp. QT6929]WHN66537.1 linear amide C-N hydrolase [Cysteiniphilum sp. QT6929]
MMKIKSLFCLSLSACLSANALACTNVISTGNGYTAVARTMDFAVNTGNKIGYAKTSTENVSNINLYQSTGVNPVKWKNSYDILGQTGFGTNIIADGINSAGVYAGYLYLPAITQFPTFDPKNKKPELGAMDTLNYVLGTSKDVPEAFANLQKVQIVANAVGLTQNGKTTHFVLPLHLIIRDKHGNSLLIEWIKGQSIAYMHLAGTNSTQRYINFAQKAEKTYPNFNMSTVTNTPSYDWHIHNVKKYDKLYNGNNNTKVDGLIMNGSGFTGLPGDYTPPSRLARTYEFAKFSPAPTSPQVAVDSALGLIYTDITPLSGAVSPTLWVSLSDLNNAVYYWKPILSVENENGVLTASPYSTVETQFTTFNLHNIKNTQGFARAAISQEAMLSQQQTKEALAWLNNTAKPGGVHAKTAFSNKQIIADGYNLQLLKTSEVYP